MGYIIVISALILKINRLHKIVIVATTPLSQVIKDKKKIIKFEMLLFLSMFIPYIPLSVLHDQIHFVTTVTATDEFQNPIESEGICKFTDEGFDILYCMFSFLLLLFLICVRLCFVARHDESVNNDVIYIFMSVFNLLQFVSVNIASRFMVSSPVIRFEINAACIMIALGGVCVSIMVPKFMKVYSPGKNKMTLASSDDGDSIVVRHKMKISTSSHQIDVLQKDIEFPQRTNKIDSNCSNSSAQGSIEGFSEADDGRTIASHKYKEAVEQTVQNSSVHSPICITDNIS
jgi:hypothetical protein